MPEKMEHYIGHPACTGKESEAERNTYRFLDAHGISYETFRHEAVFTMEDCAQMEKAIGAPICKNLFLCNRQQTQFYLLMLPRDKTFKTKLLSSELACARLSFADESHMTGMLGIHPGAVSPMGLINEKQENVSLVIDRELLSSEWFGCHPCVNTATLKLRMDDLLGKIVPATGHSYKIVTLKTE